MGFDYTAAVRGGLDNERINEMAGTVGKDYIAAINGGYTNQELDDLVAGEAKAKGLDTLGGAISRGLENTGEYAKAGFSRFGSYVNAVPANVYEALGMDEQAKVARDAQKYWQDSYKESQKRLQEDYHPVVAEVGSALFDPMNVATLGVGGAVATGLSKAPTVFNALKTPSQFGALGAYDTAAHIATTGDRRGVTGEDLYKTAIGTGIGMVAPATLSAGGKLLYNAAGRPFSGVSSAAYTVGKEAGMTADEVEKYVAHIPKQQQPRYIAETMGQRTSGVLKGAFQEGNQVRTAYGESLNTRAKTADIAVNKASFNEVKDAITNQFNVVSERAAQESAGMPVVMERGSIVQNLNEVRNSFIDTPQGGVINGMINRISEGQVNSVEKAVEMYRALNQVYEKARNVTDKRALDIVKEHVQEYIKMNGSKQTYKLFQQSNKNWKLLMKQKNAMELLEKNTKTLSGGSKGEVRAVNWTGLQNSLKEANLNSPESDALLDLAQRYSKKFGTRDIDFVSQTTTQQTNPVDSLATEGSGFFQRIGIAKFGNFILDHLPFNNSAALRRAQFDIAKAIKNAHSPKEFLEKVRQSDFTKENINKQTKSILAKDSNNIGATPQEPPAVPPAAQTTSNSTVVSDDIVADVARASDSAAIEEMSAVANQADNVIAREESQASRPTSGIEQEIDAEISVIPENIPTRIDGVGTVTNSNGNRFVVRADNGEDPQSAITALRRVHGDDIEVEVTRNGSQVNVYRPASNAINSEIIATQTNNASRMFNDIIDAGSDGVNTQIGRATKLSGDSADVITINGSDLTNVPSVSQIENLIRQAKANKSFIALQNRDSHPIFIQPTSSAEEIASAIESYRGNIQNRINEARQQRSLSNMEQATQSTRPLADSLSARSSRSIETSGGHLKLDDNGNVYLEFQSQGLVTKASVKSAIRQVLREQEEVVMKVGGRDYRISKNAPADEFNRKIEAYTTEANRIVNNQPSPQLHNKAKNFFGVSQEDWDRLGREQRNNYVEEMKDHPEYNGKLERGELNNFDMSTPTGKAGYKLSKVLDDWDVSVGGSGNTVIARHQDYGSFEMYNRNGNSWSMYTGNLRNGSGSGGIVYHAAWDAIEKAGGIYKPSNTLLTANPVKMTINMLAYMYKRKKDANHLVLNRSQRGASNLDGKSLTVANAKMLTTQFRTWLNRSRHMPTGQNISARSTDAEIEAWANRLGQAREVRLGERSLKLLRKLLRNRGDVTAFSAIMAALVAQDDFMEIFPESESSSL